MQNVNAFCAGNVIYYFLDKWRGTKVPHCILLKTIPPTDSSKMKRFEPRYVIPTM